MNKKSFYCVFVLFIFVFLVGVATAQKDDSEKQIQEGLEKAEALQQKIMLGCKKDPYTCSCQMIPCDELLQSDHSQVKVAYDRCVSEKNNCEKNRQNAIKQMEQLVQKIEMQCRKNLKVCDCSEVTSEDGKKKCELAVIEARYQAEKERADKIKICVADPDKCDCGSITNEDGKKECGEKLSKAKEQKEQMKKSCRENLLACDCSVIESESGKQECETKKSEALAEAENAVKSALSKCFKNVDKCQCDQLGLEDENYVSFCKIQKSYGLNCKREGIDCDKLENVEIYPAGMPPWLGKFFARTYKNYIEAEKEKGVKEAASFITGCLSDPKECDCSKAPSYARAHCERTKALQIKCYADDYTACQVLENAPNLPEGVPSFSYSFLEKLINKLRSAKEQMVKANAARKVGNMILECMDDASKCNCSLAPSGSIKTFCEHKKQLVGQCRENKHYESCFALDEEPILPSDTPPFIRNFVESSIMSKINEKKQRIFDEMKQGTICADIATIKECKEVFYKNL